MKKNKKIVIGAGGTGGHLFPASAIKKALEKRGYSIYLITDKRGLRFASKFENISVIIGGGMSGENFFYRLKSLLKLAVGFMQTFYYMLKIRPVAVIGMGGYISVPVVLWGKFLRKKTFIHNADSILGNANILLSKFADITMVSFKDTKKIPPQATVKFTGLPLREDVKDVIDTPYPSLSKNKKLVITVMGGSQGAKIFSDVVANAVAMFSESVRKKLFIYQQVVEEDIENIQKFYKKNNISAEIKPFFKNPAELLAKSNIFIGRAGASTVLEVGSIGRPCIFIPIMHKDRQQFINAEQITSVGGGEILPQPQFSAKNLHKILKNMVENPNLLENMAKNAKIFKIKNDASENIAKLVDKEIAK